MCMTLAMTLGMSIGVKKTLWMMLGELAGVALVAIASVISVSALLVKEPVLFQVLKFMGAAYLLFIGINMYRSKGKLALNNTQNIQQSVNNTSLLMQGFVTAIANPKGWAFMISLLPPFINKSYALPQQLTVLIVIIMISEFICMMLYAAGGKTIGKILTKRDNVKNLNKTSGILMIAVGVWLALS